MTRKIFQMLLCFVMLLSLAGIKLKAHEKSEGMGLFSIELLPSKGQDTSIESYYEMDVSHGLDSEISIRVLNHQDKAIQVVMTVSQAMSNHYGHIQYKHPFESKNFLESVQKVTDFVSPTEQRMTIPAQEAKIMTLDIKVPQNTVDGDILGGITLQELDDENSSGMASNYSYVVALVLKDDPGVLKSSETLDYQSSEIVEINHRPFLQVQFLNPEAKVLDNLSLDIRLKQKGQEVFKHQKEGLQMAPQTKMRYTVPLNELKLDDQDLIEIYAKSHGNSWHFKDEIHTEVEPKSNKETVDKKGKEAILGFLMLLAITIIYTMKKIVRRNV